LEAVCDEYGVALDSAHDATSDALAAARLACAIAVRHPKVASLGPAELHRRQIEWYAAWAADFQDFLRRKGDAAAIVDSSWPLRETAGEPVLPACVRRGTSAPSRPRLARTPPGVRTRPGPW